MDCELCANAERTPLQRLLAKFDRPSALAMVASSVTAYSIIMTGRTEPSWYEKHREAYARTGDERELTRMLRHVSA